MAQVQRSDLVALRNEIDRLWRESRLLREKSATSWELARATFVKDLVSPFLALPMLRGLWVASVNSAGAWIDISGHVHHLTYNGDPVVNYDGLVPYWDYDGTGDYHSRADEADLDILGTESYVAAAARGLTFGGCFYPTSTTSAMMMGKADDTNGPYFLYNAAGTQVLFRIRDAGDANNFDVTIPLTLNTWQLAIARFKPGLEIKVWNNDASNTNTTSIPASILNGADSFAIGAAGGGETPFIGRAAFCFLCACAISDEQRSSVLEQTRGAFGV